MASEATTMKAAEKRRCRAALQAKLKELLRTGLGRRRELEIEQLADPSDLVKSEADRDMAVQQCDYRTHLIHEIQAALGRIEDGTYGFCERCKLPMPHERLAVIPWASLCVPCQSVIEAASRAEVAPHRAKGSLEQAA